MKCKPDHTMASLKLHTEALSIILKPLRSSCLPRIIPIHLFLCLPIPQMKFNHLGSDRKIKKLDWTCKSPSIIYGHLTLNAPDLIWKSPSSSAGWIKAARIRSCGFSRFTGLLWKSSAHMAAGPHYFPPMAIDTPSPWVPATWKQFFPNAFPGYCHSGFILNVTYTKIPFLISTLGELPPIVLIMPYT